MATILYDEESKYTLTLTQLLGRGSQGLVWQAMDINRKKYAVKVVQNDTQQNEIRISKILVSKQQEQKFKHIVRFHQLLTFKQDPQHTYIQLEYCDGGSLDSLLKSQNLEESQRIDFMIQLVEAVEQVHSIGIVHRDLKPENVVSIMEERRPILKFCDFGIAKSMSDVQQSSRQSYLGTLNYMNPLKNGEITVEYENDVWSLGTMFYEVYTSEKLFDGDDCKTINDKRDKFHSLAEQERRQYLREKLFLFNTNYNFIGQMLNLLVGILNPNKESRLKLEKIKATLLNINYLITREYQPIYPLSQNLLSQYKPLEKSSSRTPLKSQQQRQRSIKIFDFEVQGQNKSPEILQYDSVFNAKGVLLINNIGLLKAIQQIEREVENLG